MKNIEGEVRKLAEQIQKDSNYSWLKSLEYAKEIVESNKKYKVATDYYKVK